MRRLSIDKWLTSISIRFISGWNDGSDGYDWKSRELNEKRHLAMSYMGDVKKRVPIHDAIRLKASMNNNALSNSGVSESYASFPEGIFSGDSEEDVNGVLSLEKGIEDAISKMLMDEFSGDVTTFLNQEDSTLLKDEIFGAESNKSKSLHAWLKYKRDTADYKSYASLPESERNDWSAWYLRHVKSSPQDDD